jgi:hypothetical protein
MTDFEKALQVLSEGGVQFVIVGGYALSTYGSAYVTVDLDICYERSRKNLNALATALEPFHPKLRGAPDGLPFTLDAETLQRGMNFTLTTDFGDLDLLGEMTGVGQYDAAVKGAETITLFGSPCLIVSPEVLYVAKKAAGRTKDKLTLPELEAIIELRRQRK